MELSQNGLNFIKAHEGLRLYAYQDSGGIWTIGYGTTTAAGVGTIKEGMRITEAVAEMWLHKSLASYEATVNKGMTREATQNQYDAMVSLCYNIGAGGFLKSTVLRKFNAGDFEGAMKAFALWNKAGGKVLDGLIKRRRDEAALFSKPDPAVPGTTKEKGMFEGKKTYITGIVAIVSAVGGYLTGTMDLSSATQIIIPALIGMFLRQGVTSEVKKATEARSGGANR